MGKPPARTVGSKRDTSPSLSGQRRLGVVALLVRAKHNQSLGRQTPNLFDTAQTQPVRERLEIHVARTSASRGPRRQKAHGKREARKAVVELPWFAVELPPPETSGFRNEAPNWFASAGASMTGIMSRNQAARPNTSVIAWRLTALAMMGRETQELPADILFSDIEIMALEDFASDRRLPSLINSG